MLRNIDPEGLRVVLKQAHCFIAFAMMIAGVIIAYLLNLDINQKPNERICVRFGTADSFSKVKERII